VPPKQPGSVAKTGGADPAATPLRAKPGVRAPTGGVASKLALGI